MLVYEKPFPEHCFSLLPSDVKQHIMEIVESSPTSQFYYHTSTEEPNVYAYLIEHNLLESYTLFHAFSCDRIGEDYSYQSFPADQIHMMHQLILQANIT